MVKTNQLDARCRMLYGFFALRNHSMFFVCLFFLQKNVLMKDICSKNISSMSAGCQAINNNTFDAEM